MLLMLVVVCNIIVFIEFFLNKGVDVNVKDKYEMSLFYYVVVNGWFKIILLLIEVGCGVSDVNDWGMMLLYFVV